MEEYKEEYKEERVGTEMGNAVLTIDDMPSKNTPAIVDYLQEKEIPAIMFAVGEKLEKYYDEALYALKGGVIVGNHSYSHPSFSALTMEQAVAEIEKTEKLLDALYRDAGVKRCYRPFRFPYGDGGGENEAALQEYFKCHGFHKVEDTFIRSEEYAAMGRHCKMDTLWTFDFKEWDIRPGHGFTKEDVLARIHDDTSAAGRPLLEKNANHLLLLHAHDETEQMVPGYYRIFLEEVMANGIRFISPSFVEADKVEASAKLHAALRRLKAYAAGLCRQAGKDDAFLEQFWEELCDSEGMLREFAYYHDTGSFLCEKKVRGYSVADILVWQVDHFKAYLDRGEDCLRYEKEKLLLAAFDTLMKMEKNPAPYVEKLQGESGTDKENPQC